MMLYTVVKVFFFFFFLRGSGRAGRAYPSQVGIDTGRLRGSKRFMNYAKLCNGDGYRRPRRLRGFSCTCLQVETSFAATVDKK